ncbi:toxin HicA [Chloroflexota bacterium]
MTKKEKRLEKARRNPKNVSFEDLRCILFDHGFVEISSRGSHHTFRYGKWRLTVARRKPHVLATYVKQAIRIIDKSNEEDSNG